MSTNEDVEWVRRLLGPIDPMGGDTVTESDLRTVRGNVRRAPRAEFARVAAGIVILALAIASLVPMARSPAAWAVEERPSMGTVVRVELPGFLQRGADPTEVVAALRQQGVEVELVDQIDLRPWRAGRIVGTGFSLTGVSEGFAEDFMDPQRRADGDFSEVGLILLPSGGFLLLPDTFDGTVRLSVGRLPGQSAVLGARR